MTDCVPNERRGVVNVDLFHQARPVILSCLDLDAEEGGDLLGRLPLGYELEYLPFTRAQRLARQHPGGPQTDEDRDGRVGPDVNTAASYFMDRV